MMRAWMLFAIVACGPKKPPSGSADGSSKSSKSSKSSDSEPVDGSSPAKAAALVNSPELPKVKDGLSRLESMDQKTPEVLYNQGVAHQKLGDLEKAKDAYTKATAIDPSFGQAWLNLGAVAERQGD